jgi:WhiB family redox-sensing transcriptional regulator
MFRGDCSADPELFFTEDPASGDRAKAICAGCPVRDRCLSYALKHRLDDGASVWGGLSGRERRVLRTGGEKTCPRCAETKALDKFGRQANKPDGLHTYCLMCSQERDAARREQRMAAQRKRRQRSRKLREAAAA